MLQECRTLNQVCSYSLTFWKVCFFLVFTHPLFRNVENCVQGIKNKNINPNLQTFGHAWLGIVCLSAVNCKWRWEILWNSSLSILVMMNERPPISQNTKQRIQEHTVVRYLIKIRPSRITQSCRLGSANIRPRKIYIGSLVFSLYR